MQVVINGNQVTIPSSLSEITLGQKIEFQRKYGNIHDEKLKSILEIKDEFEKELELTQFQVEQMFDTFAFFAGVEPQALRESEFVDAVANIYYSCLSELNIEQNIVEPLREFVWKGEMWYLDAPSLKHGDKMTFGEVIDSKQVIQNMIGFGANKWECLVPLASIFLRKKDEAYQESFLYENSERQNLMYGLPFDIALHVAFFLKGSMSLYMKNSRYFTQVE